ncbi:bifunctional metallophosphatase/5'-nucleotidase [Bacillus sp. CMF21]|uniref:bifunctional metallophosphatase/5'-nucleotidase n=1 Tax=Metabacillus dongyingensis TaxID=2874282 RepID=UPI001CBEDF36|nr:bifunctional UDP-sugar hydrolase/5'-nucleotidase [Metabacillus dongyingensis]UAL54665.1 bifunctional metallophosphatase/5'-nucleotidase [Metabacillus dongyingensis]USK30974.1 bifunctional metallophosphatase/5'-nucleotidase [Bacillus sp. CMF21]
METVRLTILQTSDIHGHILPLIYSTNEEQCLGLAKISTVIKKERNEHDNVLLIDNGDCIQGTPLTYYYAKKAADQKNPVIAAMNALGYDAAVIGNHEFNYGSDFLKKAADQSEFPWLSANIKENGEPLLGKPYIMKNYCGVKVAVLGVTTHYIPNWEDPKHIKELSFHDAFQSAKHWTEYIRKNELPDLLIVSYHGGFERDLKTGEPTEVLTGENQAYQFCHEIEGIDVLLTGHQHRSISGEINGVTVIQPGFNGRFAGKIEITFSVNDNGTCVKEKSPMLVDLTMIETDQSIIELIQPFERETQKWLDQPIGKINGNMLIEDPFAARMVKTAFIEFINKVQMDASGTEISNTALFDNSSRGFPENPTMRDIVSNYIYPNTLKVLRLKGRDIRAALERSASYFMCGEDGAVIVNPKFQDPKPQHYNYDMWEGIEYILDVSKPIGERVVLLEKEGKPLEHDGEYDVVMNNYRASGGGEYTMFKGKEVIKEVPVDMSELIANHLLEKKEVQASLNHNWKVICS